jgi:hypothetical protein
MALSPHDQLTIDNARELARLHTVADIRAYEDARGTPAHYFDADETAIATSYAIAFGRAAATINQLASLIEYLTETQ